MKTTYPGTDTLYTYQYNAYGTTLDATLHPSALAYEYQHKGNDTPKSDDDTVNYLIESFGYNEEKARYAIEHMARLSVQTLQDMLELDVFYVITYGYGVAYPIIFRDFKQAEGYYLDLKDTGKDVVLNAVYCKMEAGF